jgi:hypothetical protein
MAIYELTTNELRQLPTTGFASEGIKERADLQRLLRDQIDIVSPETLILAEEFSGWGDSQRRIDLLGLDTEANLVVVELKRDDTGGHMELQAIRYAGMVSNMTFNRAVEVLRQHLNRVQPDQEHDPETLILEHLDWEEPDEDAFAQDVRIVLAAADFGRELTSAVLWLNTHLLDIRCVRLVPYRDGPRVLLDIQTVIPLPEAADYITDVNVKKAEAATNRKAKREWTGLYFLNLGMFDENLEKEPFRHWSNCRELGYTSAGGGHKWSGKLRKLKIGDPVAAYAKGHGYVGIGLVTGPARPLHLFEVAPDTPLHQHLEIQNPNAHPRAEATWEWAVPVAWKHTVDLEDAKWFKGASALPFVVYRIKDHATARFLEQEFGFRIDKLADETLGR